MKDSELRGIVLKFLYDRRREDGLLFGAVQGATDIPGSLDMKDWLRACNQLGDYNLIEWDPFLDHTGDGIMGGYAKINGFGTAVIARRTKNRIWTRTERGGKIQTETLPLDFI
jgi:hypothetical protein